MSATPSIRLSQEQQQVVDYPAQPLRVSAGAGTGKTTTVSHRIAQLVKQEQIAPEQALGLTFTNKASQELSHRLQQVLSHRADPHSGVQVNTYHGFCYQIISEFGALLGIERGSPLINPAQTRQLVKQVIRETPLTGWDNTDFFHLPGAITRFCSILADHLQDPDQVTAEMLRCRAPDLGKDDFPTKGAYNNYLRLLETLQKRRGLVEAARQYQRHKRRLGVVDYGDLISQAHLVLKQVPEKAQQIRARYRVVVADEYQDTNAAQREILQLLFGDGFSLTVIGDSDQTLYEWRGASLENFQDFPVHFPDADGKAAPTLPLTFNRRSGKEIIRFANQIKARIGSDTNDLQALPNAPESRIGVRWHPTFIDEAEWIAEQMTQRHRDGRDWKEMAVLFRKTKDIARVYKQLLAADIPVEMGNRGGLLMVPEVVEICSWLRVVGRFDDREAAARLLSGSRYRLGMGDIRYLSKWAYRRADGSARALLDSLDDPRFWKELPEGLEEPYRRFQKEYRFLLSACQSITAGEACRVIMDRTRAWADVDAMPGNARLSARLNLYRFLELAESWSPLEGPATVGGFLEYLDAIAEEPSEELDTARLSGEDAVALLTVHKAKGLEWPVVFIPAIYNGNFPSTAVGGYDDPYRRPEIIPWDWRIDEPTHDRIHERMDAGSLTAFLKERVEETKAAHSSQEWRVAYVAATRAKQELVLSGADWYGYPEPTIKPRRPQQSEFFKAAWLATQDSPPEDVDQALEDAYPPTDRPETFADPPQSDASPDPVFNQDGWAGGIRLGLEDAEALAQMAGDLEDEYRASVEEFQGMLFRLPEPDPPPAQVVTTSATDLVGYAQCPKKYFWTRVEPLPRRYSYVTRRGTRIHRQIEMHHQGKASLLEPDHETLDLQGDDRPAVSSGGLGPFEVFLQSRFAGMEVQWLERAFSLRLSDDLLVRGRIDAVYRSGPDSWEIVDFKSGQPPPEDPYEARLAQMQVYALAVSEVPELGPPPANLSVTIAYLGGGRLVESPAAVPVERAWLASACARLGKMADLIATQNWAPTPSGECRKCDFFHLCPEGKTFISSIGRKT